MGTLTLEFRNKIQSFEYTSIVEYPKVDSVVFGKYYMTIDIRYSSHKYQLIQLKTKDIIGMKTRGEILFYISGALMDLFCR